MKIHENSGVDQRCANYNRFINTSENLLRFISKFLWSVTGWCLIQVKASKKDLAPKCCR